MFPRYHRQLHSINHRYSNLDGHARHLISLDDLVLRPRCSIYHKREPRSSKTVSRIALRRKVERKRAMQERALLQLGSQSIQSTQSTQHPQDNQVSQTTAGSSTNNEPGLELRGGNVSPQPMCPGHDLVLHPGHTIELPLRPALSRRIAKLDRDRNRDWRRQPIIHVTEMRQPDEEDLWEDLDADADSDADTNYTLVSSSPTTLPYEAQTPRDAAQPRTVAWRRCLPPWEVPVLSRMTF